MDEVFKLFSTEDLDEVKELCIPKEHPITESKLWGYNIIPGLCASSVEYAYTNWDLQERDIVVVAFPKTGTNWITEICRQIIYQDKSLCELTKTLPFSFHFLEYGEEKKFKFVDQLPFKKRLFGTHLPADLINMSKLKKANAKVVYNIRNPKDQIASWFEYGPKMPMGKVEPWLSMFNSGWDNYFEHVIAGHFHFHSKPGEWYPEHILSWYKHRDNTTVYFVSYEDIKKDSIKEIKMLAEFLEIPLTDEKAREISVETSFRSMKEEGNRSANEHFKAFRNINLRKGEVGDWKNYFTENQSELIDKMMEEKFKDTDIKFIYK